MTKFEWCDIICVAVMPMGTITVAALPFLRGSVKYFFSFLDEWLREVMPMYVSWDQAIQIAFLIFTIIAVYKKK